MTGTGPWRTEEFDSLSWHDVHVHGFRLDTFKDENGSADLVLDIDYILKWERSGDGFLFTVCRAELRFHDVVDLKFALDYATPTAGMCPFMIDGIEREPMQFSTGYKSYRWRLPVSWPKGSLEFQAPAFTQTLTGTPRVQPHQALGSEQRGGGGIAA
jgi:hypothetical protein